MAGMRSFGVGLILAAGLLLFACTNPIPDGCMTGRLTADGEICQTMKSNQDHKTYSFFQNMNGYELGDEVCICGAAAQMSRCKVGAALDLTHMDRKCPTLENSQYTYPLD